MFSKGGRKRQSPLPCSINKLLVFGLLFLYAGAVMANLGSSGITTKSPHSHAALLFLDYLHSKEGQSVLIKGGLSSPREDIGSLEQKFKKSCMETQYSLEEFQKKFGEWQELMRQLFVRKR
jgi:ABC-type Fe3+ transport system substrate-binding protein